MAPYQFVENNYQKHLGKQINAILQGYCTAFDIGEILYRPRFCSKIPQKATSKTI